jgi:hypothetical protein
MTNDYLLLKEAAFDQKLPCGGHELFLRCMDEATLQVLLHSTMKGWPACPFNQPCKPSCAPLEVYVYMMPDVPFNMARLLLGAHSQEVHQPAAVEYKEFIDWSTFISNKK